MLSSNVENSKIGSTAQTIFAISNGVEVILLKVVATSVNIISDASLLLIIGIGLIIVDAPTALISGLIFLITGVGLYRFMYVEAQELGVKSANLEIRNNEFLMELISTFREIHVRDRRRNYIDRYQAIRRDLAVTNVDINFQPLLSKYTVEAVLVIGAITIAGLQFVLKDATHAIASLTIFLAAGTRLAPAFLRLQQSAVQIRGSLGSAWPTLSLINKLEPINKIEFQDSGLDTIHSGFQSTVRLRNVFFHYPNSSVDVLSGITLDIPEGSFIAVVGPSGSGKSTLADVILGVNSPTSGEVLISGVSPASAIKNWPGAVGYVPQEVPIVKGSIFRNVSLGFESDAQALACAESAVSKAQLSEFVNSQSCGMLSDIAEGGQDVSGGQRQRIGVARALFTSPKLLVMDEATSSLDGITEEEISKSINSLKGRVTLVVIAHRLSTIRNADMVVYLSEGQILSTGSFDDVRRAVPNFDIQASLMGL
jgi:ABC-type bacteriocin/lantibiotic exporter with double-glycine peptidase domain